MFKNSLHLSNLLTILSEDVKGIYRTRQTHSSMYIYILYYVLLIRVNICICKFAIFYSANKNSRVDRLNGRKMIPDVSIKYNCAESGTSRNHRDSSRKLD